MFRLQANGPWKVLLCNFQHFYFPYMYISFVNNFMKKTTSCWDKLSNVCSISMSQILSYPGNLNPKKVPPWIFSKIGFMLFLHVECFFEIERFYFLIVECFWKLEFYPFICGYTSIFLEYIFELNWFLVVEFCNIWTIIYLRNVTNVSESRF